MLLVVTPSFCIFYDIILEQFTETADSELNM